MALFYAYVNILDPLVAWEAAIGRYCSADNLESEQVFSLSLRQFSLFRRYAALGDSTRQIRNELLLEGIRAQRHADVPSRLRGVFLFENLGDAEAAAQRWDGRHFNASFLSEIEMTPDRSAGLDSEWITFNLATDNDPSWMDRYWRGEVCGVRPLTEVISSGVGAILNKDLRERAYRQIMELYPKAVPLLSVACVGFRLGFSRVAQIVPYLLRDGSKVRAVHLLNMNDLNNESPLLAALPQYKDPWPPLAGPWDGIIQVPDLTSSWFELEMSELSALVAQTAAVQPPYESALNHVRNVHTTRH